VNIHQAQPVADDWDEVKAELSRAFQMAQEAALAKENFVFVVHHDDLLGRRGTGNAMVATGLLSAARTAAIEGSRKGWTANVVAFDDDANPELVQGWAERLAEDSNGVTGELIRVGASHLGKALP
jgi:ABC-type branched-subunit amino acid transport system substrate-binding protein